MHDRALAVRDRAAPKPDDITLCAYCGAILKFTADMSLLHISGDEWLALPLDQRTMLARVQRAILTVGPGRGQLTCT